MKMLFELLNGTYTSVFGVFEVNEHNGTDIQSQHNEGSHNCIQL
jgi:hypothetical protein